jgi:hypothetical protein
MHPTYIGSAPRSISILDDHAISSATLLAIGVEVQ